MWLPVMIMLHVASGEDAPPRGAYVLEQVMKRIDGTEVDLRQYAGKVLVMVNTASKCGFTPQYAQLEAVYAKYRDQGLAILAFPSNDFLRQEPGDAEQIQQFCRVNYGVTFDLFAKIRVRGKDKAPLYEVLTSKEKNAPYGGGIKWNFTKFIIGRDGKVCARFGPPTKPDASGVIEVIERELAKPSQ